MYRSPVRRFMPLAVSLLAFVAVTPAVAQPLPLPIDDLTPQTPLAPKLIPMFVQKMPVLDVTPEPLWASYPKFATVLPSALDPTGADPDVPYTLKMCEFQAQVLPTGPATHVWGYRKGSCPPRNETQATYLGPVFVTLRDRPTFIRYVNELPRNPEPWSGSNPGGTSVIAYRDSIDQTLHWAASNMQMCMSNMPPALRDVCTFPYRTSNGAMGIPAVPHLHGGEVPAELDGGPEAWFTSTGEMQGATYYSHPAYTDPDPIAPKSEAVYRYPNTQEAGPLWFHDHTLGATRLNVYAGLAGAYVLVDPAQNIPPSLQDPTRIVPVVIQDRMFDTNNELFFTSGTKGNVLWALNPEHPYWNPEFVGDTIAVNGKVWPYLEVEPKRYRFLFVNGSNARTYELFFTNAKTKINGPPIYVIGTDGGYLDSAQKIDPNALKPAPQKLVMMPGERYEVVVDFTGQVPGSTLVLKNVAKTPYPAGATPIGGLGQVLQVRVTCPPTGPCGTGGIEYDPASTPEIRMVAAGRDDRIVPLVNFAAGTVAPGVTIQKTRSLTLNEVMGMPVNAVNPIDGQMTAYPGGPLEILVNNTRYSGESARNSGGPPVYRGDFVQLADGRPFYSEMPKEGETELWEIVNLTADSHPIHLHLVQFQLMNRQAFDVAKYDAAYAAAFPKVLGDDGKPLMIGMNTCSGGVYCPGYGPPLDYFGGAKLGGNPDVLSSLKGAAQPPSPQERGWKDTVQAPPGMVTRFVVRWAPTSAPAGSATPFPFDPSGGGGWFNYVWHCHIIDHEDNEMMRPDTVEPSVLESQRAYRQGIAY